MYDNCPKCRASNRSSDAKCYSCGSSMQAPSPTEQPPALTLAERERRAPSLTRLFLVVLLIGAGVGGWYTTRSDTNLRIEVVRFTDKGTGLLSHSVRPNDKIFLQADLRGWTADKSGMCNGRLTAWFEGPWPLYFQNGFQIPKFRKNSDITHVPISETLTIPSHIESGEYTLHLKLKDLNSDNTVDYQHQFRVIASESKRDQRAHRACVEQVDRVANMCLTHLMLEKKAPANWEDLVPDYLSVEPICPAVGEANYGLKLNGNRFRVFCKGNHHSEVGAGENRPYYGGTMERIGAYSGSVSDVEMEEY
jgi:hypothetical protein